MTWCSTLLAVLAVGGVRPAEADLARSTTEHYDLRIRGTEGEAAHLAAMLEAAWPTFREFFRAEPRPKPGERLTIKVYDTMQACLDGAMDDRADMPPKKHPAWFSPSNGTVYLYRHKSVWFTRYLLLYGACLQFHGLAKAKNIDLDAWYVHGIAESFAVHAYDGERLQLGTSPPIAWIDHPAGALEALGGPRLGLDPFTDARLENQSVRWTLVRFAMSGAGGRYRPRFEKLALGFSGSKLSGHDLMRAMADEPRIAEEYSTWLLANQMPLEVIHPDWEALPDGRVLATPGADGLSLCAAKKEFTSIEFAVDAPTDRIGGVPAVVLGFQKIDDYLQARIVPPIVFLEHVRNGNQIPIETLSLGTPGAVLRVQARAEGPEARLEIDGKAFPPIEIPPGRVGLSANKGPVFFSGMRCK